MSANALIKTRHQTPLRKPIEQMERILKSQSLRKSGQFLPKPSKESIMASIEASQSLRKSGQFLQRTGLIANGRLAGRNPFVSQVNFFSESRQVKGQDVTPMSQSLRKSGQFLPTY